MSVLLGALLVVLLLALVNSVAFWFGFDVAGVGASAQAGEESSAGAHAHDDTPRAGRGVGGAPPPHGASVVQGRHEPDGARQHS